VAGAGIERNAAGHFGIRGRDVAGECGLAVSRLCGACARSGIGSQVLVARSIVKNNRETMDRRERLLAATNGCLPDALGA
jgi:hypothetical protein